MEEVVAEIVAEKEIEYKVKLKITAEEAERGRWQKGGGRRRRS
jgi:hypothetical protein